MKKSIFTLAIILSLFSVVLFSCNKDDDDDDDDNNGSPANTEVSSTYKLVMNGNIVAEGTSTNKILLYGTTLNMGGTGSELVITITNVPVSIGGSIEIEETSGVNGEYCQLSISGTNLLANGADEIYWGTDGTVTRTSATKISFTGICKEDAAGTITHTFIGNVESDAYKVN